MVLPKEEKPQNGIPGLKYWRHDLSAGLQVALLGLPLSLGIAVASGAPPVSGVISAIIAGLVFPLLGGTYVTIGGPAVGLAPASLVGIVMLGQGDLHSGYPLFLVAVVLAGVLQVVLSRYDVGRLAMYFPNSVLQGMLMAIGVLIIIQQLPALLGQHSLYSAGLFTAIRRLPEHLANPDPKIFFLGGTGLILLLVLNSRNLSGYPWLRTQSPLLVVIWGGVVGWWLQIPGEYRISVSDDLMHQVAHLPDFATVWARPDLWFPLAMTILVLTLVNGTESLATIRAIDKIDPFTRRSDPNRTLRTVGVATMCSGLAGGLTIIPGGIKSTANILAGGRTLWANTAYAGFMALFLVFGTDLLNRIPIASLAALLIFIGWKLCAPSVFARIWAVGKEQLMIALLCVLGTLVTANILVGVFLGIVTKFVLLLHDVVLALRLDPRLKTDAPEGFSKRLLSSLKELFRDPIIRIGDGRMGDKDQLLATESGAHVKHPYKVYLSSLSCMNVMKLEGRLKDLLDQTQTQHTFLLILRGYVVDHTAMEYLYYFQERCRQAGHRCIILGHERFTTHSRHALAYRVNQGHDSIAYV